VSKLQKLSRKAIKSLTSERIFKFPILGKIYTVLMIIIAFGGEKRLLSQIEAKGIVDRSTINGKMIHEALFNSHGKVRKKLAGRMNRLHIENDQSVANQNFVSSSSLFTTEQLNFALTQLRKFNFARIGTISNPSILRDLLQVCKSPVYSSRHKSLLSANEYMVDKPNPKLDFIWNVKPELLWENSAFRFLLEDSFWKYISDEFFSGNSTISGFNMWHSFPHTRESLSPENWHRDANDGLFFIKFFILLTEVTLENGPTAFIPVPVDQLPTKFLTGRRYSDREINNYCKKLNIQPIYATGPVGTVYVGDTRGLHRGTPVISNHRSLINFRVTIDPQLGINNSDRYNLSPGQFKFPERFNIF
jgi:hypothetical protein